MVHQMICKKWACENKKIKLIIIPQLFDITKPRDFANQLISQFNQLNITEYDKDKLLDIKISRKTYKE